jgi:pyruvate dehydrogenase E2 component (dihydrolipoamide acetyltransferase)
MATEIIMPKLSDTMTEGQFGIWLKSTGEKVERGDIIAEVETDKATMNLEAFASGILLEQRVQAGEIVAVGTVIGLIGEPGESVAFKPGKNIESASLKTATQPSADSASTPPDRPPTPDEIPSVSASGRSSEPTPHLEQAASSTVQAAPVVRRRAAELGIDLDTVQGSGPAGRIMLEDLQKKPANIDEPVDLTPESARVISKTETTPLSRMRRAVARTVSTAWQNIPHFYLSRDIRMNRAEQVIQELRSNDVKVSLNAMIMSAAAFAIVRFRAINAGYGETGLISHQHINLSFAVAQDEILQMPVIKDADQLGMQQMTVEVARLAALARKGALTIEDISGGSFSVSNLGMQGVDSFSSIIMPGQAAILAIGTVADRPAAYNGQLQVVRAMTATLSCDHRIIDGVIAANFLNEFKRVLENAAELPV